MLKIPYINEAINDDFIINPIKINSLPFPSGSIPEILTSPFFIIEKCEDSYFVRHIYNSLFCMPAWIQVVGINLPRNIGSPDDVEPTYEYVDLEISCLVANFSEETRSLAFSLESENIDFLYFYETDRKFSELPETLQALYKSANMQRIGYLKYNDEQSRIPNIARNMMRVLGTPL
mgnify:CR=1 FL=1